MTPWNFVVELKPIKNELNPTLAVTWAEEEREEKKTKDNELRKGPCRRRAAIARQKREIIRMKSVIRQISAAVATRRH